MYQRYEEVPYYRRHGCVSRFLWLATSAALFFQVCGLMATAPFVALLAVILFSGDVYHNEVDVEGTLKRWSFANKVAVGFLVLFHVYLFWYLYVYRT